MSKKEFSLKRSLSCENRPRLIYRRGSRRNAFDDYLIFALLLTESFAFGLVFHFRFHTVPT